MTPRKTPVSSFGPELMATLLAGATSEKVIPMPYREAVRFRLRLYQLRYAMLQENHPQAQNVRRVFIRVIWHDHVEVVKSSRGVKRPKDRDTPCKVIVAPQDSEYLAALNKAGIQVGVDDTQPDPLLGNLENPT
jgi:hypothetical protein